jgi:23S rRNA pseudouridine1911/1915/1917 synthase
VIVARGRHSFPSRHVSRADLQQHRLSFCIIELRISLVEPTATETISKLSEQPHREPALQTFEFEAGAEQERFDQFLARCLPTLSRTRIRRAIAEGDAQLNGARAAKGTRLNAGDRVSLTIAPDERSSARPEPIPLEVLHEDAELIVVNKPAGLLVHPSRTEKSGTLANALAYHFLQTGAPIRPGLIHRLDRDTSGVLVIAKTGGAHRIIAKAFRQRRVSKRYLALVHGRVAPEAGEIDAPIGRDADAWPRWRVMSEGRAAQTRFTVRQRFAGHTLLELEPLTGRTHQLRIHCAFLGHPIAGDRIYGAAAPAASAAAASSPHWLHAYLLSFRHPATGQEMTFTAPLPAGMIQAMKQLESLESHGEETTDEHR